MSGPILDSAPDPAAVDAHREWVRLSAACDVAISRPRARRAWPPKRPPPRAEPPSSLELAAAWAELVAGVLAVCWALVGAAGGAG